MARKIIVIGSGAAGMTAASTARRKDPKAEITVFTEDEHVAYSPCVIPWAIEGTVPWDDVVIHDPAFYKKNRDITVRTKTRVDSVDNKRKVVAASGGEYPYDSLIVATGGSPFVPPIPGKDLEGVFTVRTVNDGRAIQKALKGVESVVIGGAGVIGLEMALALSGMGRDVTVVEMMGQVIPRLADPDVAAPVKEYLEGKGIRFEMGAPIQAVNGKGSVESVVAGGKEFPCGMVIFATGVRANLEIPRMLELDVGHLGGVLVSPSMMPYSRGRPVENVFLAGDVVQCVSAVNGGAAMSQLGSTAVRQGIVAGSNAAGVPDSTGPVSSPWVSVLGDLQVAGAGFSESLASWYGMSTVSGKAEGHTRARYYPGGKPLTVKILADARTHRVVGAQVVSGEDATGRINWLSSAISEGVSAEEFLYRSENAYCPPTSMVRDVVLQAAEALCDKLRKVI
ncbi:MAG: FAD-dependent oxidoreductase [Thermoplasmatales archaeon]|nr:FAD-dependent oxidoreductase [Thermoplasmatales archaeon]